MSRIDLDAELAALESMPLADLRSAWARHGLGRFAQLRQRLVPDYCALRSPIIFNRRWWAVSQRQWRAGYRKSPTATQRRA